MLALAERFDKRYSFPSTLLAGIMLWATADVKSIVLGAYTIDSAFLQHTGFS
jgi:hypothetical protein